VTQGTHSSPVQVWLVEAIEGHKEIFLCQKFKNTPHKSGDTPSPNFLY